jgi:hypothetical protein
VVSHPQLPAATLRRLDDDEIESDRQTWQPCPIGKATTVEQPADRRPEPTPLAEVECLLGQTEVAARPPPDLDHNEVARRTGIDREDVDLPAPDVHIPTENMPAGELQRTRGESLGAIS